MIVTSSEYPLMSAFDPAVHSSDSSERLLFCINLSGSVENAADNLLNEVSALKRDIDDAGGEYGIAVMEEHLRVILDRTRHVWDMFNEVSGTVPQSPSAELNPNYLLICESDIRRYRERIRNIRDGVTIYGKEP